VPLPASLVFLTPWGAIAMLAAVVPLAGLALAERRERRAREVLKLSAPPPASHLRRAAALVAVPAILGLAATQPALQTTKSARVRTDAQAMFVLDISRSMLASRSATSATRLARAKAYALQIREAIPEVPSGIATMTDRVVPSLLPNADLSVFADTLNRAVQLETPPPISSDVLATELGSLGSLGTQNFFPPSARHRVAVVLTDGEGVSFDPNAVARQLAAGGVKLVIVHVWNRHEAVYDSGVPEQAYQTRPQSNAAIASLVTAAGGRAFGEGSIGAAARAVQADAGSGPTIVQGRVTRTQTLAPYIALVALVPLLFVLPRVGRGIVSALRLLGAEGLAKARGWQRGRTRYAPPGTQPARESGA
jgi:hypothetical protein